MNKQNTLAIVVLNYNGKMFVNSLYYSIQMQTYNEFDLIVLDNASTDDSVDKIKNKVKKARIIEFKNNIGFARAFNYAAKNLSYDFLLFLNNDLYLAQNCVENLMKICLKYPKALIFNSKAMYWKDKSIINAAGGKLTYIGGAYLIGNKEKDNRNHNKIIGAAYGASMLIKRDLFLKLGGFDPDFFMYHEEADLCWRSWLYNHPIIYCSSSVVYHFESLNWAKNPKLFNEFHKIKNRNISIIKNNKFPYIITFEFLSLIFDIFTLIKSKELIYGKAILKAYLYILNNIGCIIKKRREVQSNSVNSFQKLRKIGLFSSFSELIRRFTKHH